MGVTRSSSKCKDFVLLVDTREQNPYKNFNYVVETATLENGDYSIKGCENEFAVERKSLADWTGSTTQGRERFEKEVENLSNMVFAAVVVETDFTKIWKTPLYSKVSRKSLVNTALKWSVKYGIPIQFVSNRTGGKYAVEAFAEAFWKYHINGDI